MEIISSLPEDATISLYRCGPMVRSLRYDLLHLPKHRMTSIQMQAKLSFIAAAWPHPPDIWLGGCAVIGWVQRTQVDLCRGPHLPHSGLLKATAIQALSRAHWRGDVTREGLQVLLDILSSGFATALLLLPGWSAAKRK